jgi:CheY-like chemotaxis protein
MRVLVVEDFEILARTIGTGLRREGMAVDVVLDGNDALDRLAVTRYDVVVLDRDLPGVHGDEVCRRIVAGRAGSRVLMLTAASTVQQRVEGLGLGADDYLPKPFDFAELVARIRALGRRSAAAVPPTLENGPRRLPRRREPERPAAGRPPPPAAHRLRCRPRRHGPDLARARLADRRPVPATLRTITATARDISASNLHRRLGLSGRDDEFKELAETLDDLFERLQTSFESQRHFVANASHELRTPLTAERTLLQVALADPDATAETLRSTCRDVLALGEQQERLIEALLTLASGEQGIEQREPFDLAEIAGNVVLARHQEARRRDIRVDTALATAPAAGDPNLVESLVANLVDNALRQTRPEAGSRSQPRRPRGVHASR